MEAENSIHDNAPDTRTLVESPKSNTIPSASSLQSDERIVIEDTQTVYTSPPYVDKPTGRHMIELLYFTPTGLHRYDVCLDDCKFNRCESGEPELDEEEIEGLFSYKGFNFWVYVPFGYVKTRARMDSAVSTDLIGVGLFPNL
ncbi:hypothetical protein BDV40DRAFT_281025 [Aspergillus tamarii]|uniref:Uncharacterized protein n=1 Tax=Aspergillus tamarii TaxID=41984 RepID=A0A5N6UD19_ASPTM|nr:hypothetical protein BDV40DRAFT_281025 [Aspergillus tamarii]